MGRRRKKLSAREQRQLAEKLAAYKTAELLLTEDQKAKKEQEIWQLARHVAPVSANSYRDYWRTTLAKTGAFLPRQALLNSGAGDLIWPVIASGILTSNTAHQLLQRAKRRGGDLKAAVTLELEELGNKTVPLRKDRGLTNPIRAPKPSRGSLTTKDFKRKIDDVVRGYSRQWLTDEVLSPIEVDRIVRTLCIDVAAVIELANAQATYSRKLRREQEQAETYLALVRACEFFGEEPPRNGERPNVEAIEKKYRQIARSTHPDACNGSEVNVARFHEAAVHVSAVRRYVEGQYVPVSDELLTA